MVALPHLECLWRYLFSRAVNVTEFWHNFWLNVKSCGCGPPGYGGGGMGREEDTLLIDVTDS